MTPRVRYILGGALMGAILGAIYANYVFGMTSYDKPEMFVEVVPYDEVIKQEAAYKAATDQEVTTESESGNSDNP